MTKNGIVTEWYKEINGTNDKVNKIYMLHK